MYRDYLDAVVRYYWQLVKNASVPQRLIRPTPAKIKQECLIVCRERFEKRDTRLLTAFFSAEGDATTMSKAIYRCEREKFKPLSNFLNRHTKVTDDLNIELLAWLIDFPHRPYTPENAAEKFAVAEALTGENTAWESKKQIKYSGSIRKISIAIICLLPVLLCFYLVIDGGAPKGVLNSSQQQCMIWVGDHYMLSSCEPRRGDTLVVALDLQRLRNFKRITRPDTITAWSEGKLWYIKRNGLIEYYTAGGRHPVEPGRVLRPLTRYMIEKYKDSPQ